VKIGLGRCGGLAGDGHDDLLRGTRGDRKKLTVGPERVEVSAVPVLRSWPASEPGRRDLLQRSSDGPYFTATGAKPQEGAGEAATLRNGGGRVVQMAPGRSRIPPTAKRQEESMAKGNNARKKETKKPKKGAAVKGAPDTKAKDKKK